MCQESAWLPWRDDVLRENWVGSPVLKVILTVLLLLGLLYREMLNARQAGGGSVDVISVSCGLHGKCSSVVPITKIT